MQCLIDGDLVVYEVGFKSQKKDPETGDIIPSSWEDAMTTLDNTIASIAADCYATEPPILFITNKNNFRDEVAKECKYKGNRKSDKPFHYHNLKAYMSAAYDCREREGLEADDLMCIEQNSRLKERDTIICSRDKDLRIQQGYHYSWEVAGQPRFGPAWVDEIGTLALKRGGKKLFGTGLRFFYAQCLIGDKTDNIPGVRGYGPVKVFNTLVECKTKEDLEKAVIEVYKEKYKDDWRDKLLERGRLLWMVNELNEDGSPKMWEITYE